MRIVLLLFILSIIFIFIGYSKQISPSNAGTREIEFVPRSVFDEITKSSNLKYN